MATPCHLVILSNNDHDRVVFQHVKVSSHRQSYSYSNRLVLDQSQVDLPLPKVRSNERYQRGQRRGHGAAPNSGGGTEEASGVTAERKGVQKRTTPCAAWTIRRERPHNKNGSASRAKMDHAHIEFRRRGTHWHCCDPSLPSTRTTKQYQTLYLDALGFELTQNNGSLLRRGAQRPPAPSIKTCATKSTNSHRCT